MEEGKKQFWIGLIITILALLALANWQGNMPFTGKVIVDLQTIEAEVIQEIMEVGLAQKPQEPLSFRVDTLTTSEEYLMVRERMGNELLEQPVGKLATNPEYLQFAIDTVTQVKLEKALLKKEPNPKDNHVENILAKPQGAFNQFQEPFTLAGTNFLVHIEIIEQDHIIINGHPVTNDGQHHPIGEGYTAAIINIYKNEQQPEQSWAQIDFEKPIGETLTNTEIEEAESELYYNDEHTPTLGTEYSTDTLGSGSSCYNEGQQPTCSLESCITGYTCESVTWISTCGIPDYFNNEETLPEKKDKSPGMSDARWQQIHDQLYDKKGNCKGAKVPACKCVSNKKTDSIETTNQPGTTGMPNSFNNPDFEGTNPEIKGLADTTPGIPPIISDDGTGGIKAQINQKQIEETIRKTADTNENGQLELGERITMSMKLLGSGISFSIFDIFDWPDDPEEDFYDKNRIRSLMGTCLEQENCEECCETLFEGEKKLCEEKHPGTGTADTAARQKCQAYYDDGKTQCKAQPGCN